MSKHSKQADMDARAIFDALEAEESRRPRRKKPAEVRYPRRAARKKKKQSWWAAPLAAVSGSVLFVVAALLAFSIVQYGQFQAACALVDTGVFYEGITVDGKNMAGMTLVQALKTWGTADQKAKDAYAIDVVIDSGQTYHITPESAGYTSDYADILKSAWSVGRYGTLSQRKEAIERTAGVWKRDYAVTSGANPVVLNNLIDKIANDASEAGTATAITGFDVGNKGFSFEAGTPGLVVDEKAFKEAVEAAVAAGGGSVTIERKVHNPSQSVEELKAVYGMISSCKTSARSSSANRLVNLRIACEQLNGLRIDPGQSFSYNETLGKRTKDKGYKRAPAVSGGVHTMQLGGGICQVSTTLFNAVGTAGLKITERHPHTIPSTYVKIGLDATVNWPNQDFQFTNDTDSPIYLVAGVTKQKQVVVEVHGKKLSDGVTIKLSSEKTASAKAGSPKIVMTNDLPTGERRVVESKRTGYTVITYRDYYDANGKRIERERLCKSVYPPYGGLYEEGK